jgi:allophanate hydrolase
VPGDPTGATEVALAVVGAHLSGQPLNGQLTDRGAKLLRTCRTAAAYRLFALPGTTPPKPGLLRTGAGAGAAIEVEVWSMPVAQLGAFVAGIPAPLGIGTVELEDATRALGFLCESYALEGARDISAFGGWRNYLASLTSVHTQPGERP